MISALRGADLAVHRGGRALFKNVAFSLEGGTLLSVTGANGSGKTTLLRVVAGLVRPASGAVSFANADGTMDAEDARACDMHLMGHRDGLRSSRLAGEELSFWSAFAGGEPADRALAIDMFGLTRLLDLPVAALSAGQRRRLGLARLLAAPKSLWLLDEPMAPLDLSMRDRFAGVLKTHLATGGLVIAAVHDPLPLQGVSLELAQ